MLFTQPPGRIVDSKHPQGRLVEHPPGDQETQQAAQGVRVGTGTHGQLCQPGPAVGDQVSQPQSGRHPHRPRPGHPREPDQNLPARRIGAVPSCHNSESTDSPASRSPPIPGLPNRQTLKWT